MLDKRASAVVRGVPMLLLGLVLAAAGVAIVLYVVPLMADDISAMQMANGSLPALLGATCLCCGYFLVRRDSSALWMPLPWFLAAWAAYYGLGPLSYIYGTPETVAYMDALYPVDERALLRTNLLNVVGLVAVLLGAALFSGMRLCILLKKAKTPAHDPWRVALIFLAIGMPIKYLFELPYLLRLVDNVLPGSIQYVGSFSGLAIVPLTAAAAAGRRGARTLLWAVVAAEIAVGFVMLAKIHIIITVLLVFLGQHAVRPSLKRLVITGFVVAVGYAVALSPFVNFARILLGRASAQNVPDLIAVAAAYRSDNGETLAHLHPGVQGWWSRLAYSNTQAFAMSQYDQGKPGWTFGMVGYVFVPRFLYRDKPIMTPGIDFTYFIQGTNTSSTGLGFVGEAYWNGGWLFVVVVGLFIGCLFTFLGHFSMHAVRSRRWLYTPLVFMTIYLALRPDDWFVPAYVGGVLQVLLVMMVLCLAFSAVVRRQSKHPVDVRFNRGVAGSAGEASLCLAMHPRPTRE